MHGLIFETSVCYWQNQPGCYLYIFLKEIVSSAEAEGTFTIIINFDTHKTLINTMIWHLHALSISTEHIQNHLLPSMLYFLESEGIFMLQKYFHYKSFKTEQSFHSAKRYQTVRGFIVYRTMNCKHDLTLPIMNSIPCSSFRGTNRTGFSVL